jgi:hypothetical protein
MQNKTPGILLKRLPAEPGILRTILIVVILLLGMAPVTAQKASGYPFRSGVAPNFRIYPGKVNQTEVFITRSPVDGNTLFATCNTLSFIPFFISEGIYVSVNGGESWRGNDTCTGTPIAYHGGDAAITIDKQGTFLLTRLGRSPFTGLYSHYSADNGITWSPQQVISTDDLEKAAITSDLQPGSSFSGRSYAVWVKFAMPYPLMFAFTVDAGRHWSAPEPVNNPPGRCAGGDIVVDREGRIYSCWAVVTDESPFMEVYTGFATSSNGGEAWMVNETAFPMHGINGVLGNKSNIRVNSLPAMAIDTTGGPYHGRLYIVTAQKILSPAGMDPDIILTRSNDGGVTWLPGIRVNQDPLNNGKTQYFPAIHIDRFGAVNILFYDDRNTTTDSTGVFLARSTDGGDTWHEFEISDHNFKPVPIGGLGQGYQGDMIDLTSTDAKLWPVWMDNSTGIYQIWTVPLPWSAVGAEEISAPNALRITVNPNPALGEVVITLPDRCTAGVLSISDPTGRVIHRTGIESGCSEGLRIDCSAWPGGLYIAQVQCSNGNPVTVKFIVQR